MGCVGPHLVSVALVLEGLHQSAFALLHQVLDLDDLRLSHRCEPGWGVFGGSTGVGVVRGFGGNGALR